MVTWSTRRRTVLMGAMAASLAGAAPALAETDTIRVAQQFGIGYLPLQMMREHGLIEKHAAGLGLDNVKTEWLQFSGGAAMNDALLSDNLDFASGGVGPLLTIWDRTKGSLDVKGVACLNLMPLYLNTNKEEITSLEDFGPDDRIALPSVKVSIQARTLQMALEQAGEPFDSLDDITVSMKHPDGVAALTSGGTEITGHFTSPPFMYQELRNEDPKIHKVISSYDVLGGPSTFNCVWAPAAFRDDNPMAYQAFVDALGEAMEMIAADSAAAAQVYISQTNSKEDPAFIQEMIDDPEIEFVIAPANSMKYAEFMAKEEVGAIENQPASWQDYFFEEIHDLDGS
jgi:NitT/TauT family transport system substrate-binding protein